MNNDDAEDCQMKKSKLYPSCTSGGAMGFPSRSGKSLKSFTAGMGQSHKVKKMKGKKK